MLLLRISKKSITDSSNRLWEYTQKEIQSSRNVLELKELVTFVLFLEVNKNPVMLT